MCNVLCMTESHFAVASTTIPKEEIATQVECAIRTLSVEDTEEKRHEKHVECCAILMCLQETTPGQNNKCYCTFATTRHKKLSSTTKIEQTTKAIKDTLILPADSKHLRVYVLPKIHKQNHSFRLIVSSCGSPRYYLAKFSSRP